MTFKFKAILAAVAGFAVMGAAQAQTEIKLGHVGAPGSLFAKSSEEFARIANAKLNGKAKVVVFGSSQLGNDKAMVQKLKLGTIDLALPSSVMSSEVDMFGIFEMPYLVASREHMNKIEDAVVWPTLVPAAEKKGLKIIGIWENGYRHITNNKRAINTPADLAGVKLRTPKSKWRVEMFKSYGANPTPMAFSELFTALQTGVMDGQENPFTQIYSAKLHEVQKYLSLSGHVYTPAYLTAGAKKWKSYPADVQKALSDAARETQAYVYKVAIADEAALLDKIKAAGVSVNQTDSAAFVKASAGIYKSFAAAVPGSGDLIAKAQSLR
ncbi:MAG: TRAP transporter substrate-binding protein [Burkholderiaceae bacterium]|jgi:tripartite ATP-independent transporter DctP family solute receptor|nr:TRAP transporter substrate-binding protein [Burkholderiaceae bacterium]MDO7679415.1 TRAP transporter substrate-binding protein [Burkholderiaceae bacterium]